MKRWRGLPRGDGGAFPMEAAILTPLLIAFLCLIIAFGRTTLTGNAIDAAAKAGAREASLARDQDEARQFAEDAAGRSLKQDGVQCANPPPYARAVYSERDLDKVGKVTVTVNCRVSFADISVPGMPGSKTMTGTFTSVVDRFREKG